MLQVKEDLEGACVCVLVRVGGERDCVRGRESGTDLQVEIYLSRLGNGSPRGWRALENRFRGAV